MSRKALFPIIFILISSVTLGLAQTTAGVDGTVRDAQGLVIPGVAVTLRGEAVFG